MKSLVSKWYMDIVVGSVSAAVSGLRLMPLLSVGALHGTHQSSAACLMDDVNTLAPRSPVCLIRATSLCHAVPSTIESTTCRLQPAIIFTAMP